MSERFRALAQELGNILDDPSFDILTSYPQHNLAQPANNDSAFLQPHALQAPSCSNIASEFEASTYAVANHNCVVIMSDSARHQEELRLFKLTRAVGCAMYGNKRLSDVLIRKLSKAGISTFALHGFDVPFGRLMDKISLADLPGLRNGQLGYSALFTTFTPHIGPTLAALGPDRNLMYCDAAAIGVHGKSIMANRNEERYTPYNSLYETVNEMIVDFYKGTGKSIDPLDLSVGVISIDRQAFRFMSYGCICECLKDVEAYSNVAKE